MDSDAIDRDVRRSVYDAVLSSGRVPLAAETAATMALPEDEVRASFARLAAGRVFVLQEGSAELLMASPFSAVPTPFAVESAGRHYFANCIWDALGVPALLAADAALSASCGCCGLALPFDVRGGRLRGATGLVHFAVPARRWWENIVFT